VNFPPPPNVRQIPTIGQQRQSIEQAVSQASQQLSLGIYTHLAVSYIGMSQPEPDVEHLKKLARDAQAAGRAFFEGIGVIGAAKDDG